MRPKRDPAEVVLTSHCYRHIFEQTGIAPIEQLIADHCAVTADEEAAFVVAFGGFVRLLLAYDPFERLTAAQALAHPFITGDLAQADWVPPPDDRKKRPAPPPPAPAAPRPADRFAFDFLSLM
jgi:serine/threonine protein kinase